jgi:hypothetical protein
LVESSDEVAESDVDASVVDLRKRQRLHDDVATVEHALDTDIRLNAHVTSFYLTDHCSISMIITLP